MVYYNFYHCIKKRFYLDLKKENKETFKIFKNLNIYFFITFEKYFLIESTLFMSIYKIDKCYLIL